MTRKQTHGLCQTVDGNNLNVLSNRSFSTRAIYRQDGTAPSGQVYCFDVFT